MAKKQRLSASSAQKSGFTLIEVMLFLGIAGLLLIGVLGGTHIGIERQRYNDSLRSFAEHLRTVYAEVISPESLGQGNSDRAVLGQVLVFQPGQDGKVSRIQSATLVGNAHVPENINGNFLTELQAVNATLYCGNPAFQVDDDRYHTSYTYYNMLWEAWLTKPESGFPPFEGTIVIARAPTSGTVHTMYSKELTYDLANDCKPDNQNAAIHFSDDLQNTRDPDKAQTYNLDEIGFCVNSYGSGIIREVKLLADGRNSSAVNIIDADSEENKCRR